MIKLEITNDERNLAYPDKGNYDYRVWIAGKLVASGKVIDWDRSRAWIDLIREITSQMEVIKACLKDTKSNC